MSESTMFTKTGALKRLRSIANQARSRDVTIARNARVEVGHRCLPLVTDNAVDAVHVREGDDLSDFENFKYAAEREEVRRHGAVVHIYFSNPFGFGEGHELHSIVIGWMGTPDEPALLVNADGRSTIGGTR